MARATAAKTQGRKSGKGLSGKATSVGKLFIDLLGRQSVDAKLAALALEATGGTKTDLLYDGKYDLRDELLEVWTADIQEADERGQLTEDQKHILSVIYLLWASPQ